MHRLLGTNILLEHHSDWWWGYSHSHMTGDLCVPLKLCISVIIVYIIVQVWDQVLWTKLESWVYSHNTKWNILIVDLTKSCILYHGFEIFLKRKEKIRSRQLLSYKWQCNVLSPDWETGVCSRPGTDTASIVQQWSVPWLESLGMSTDHTSYNKKVWSLTLFRLSQIEYGLRDQTFWQALCDLTSYSRQMLG